MSIFNQILKSENDPKKKIFTFKNIDLVSKLINDDAKSNATTESNVVENVLLNNYLNNNNPDLLYAIANILYSEEGNIRKSCQSIFQWFSAMPQTANDSLLPLIELMMKLELRQRTAISGEEAIIHHLSSCLDSYITLLKEYSRDVYLEFKSRDGRHYSRVSSSDVDHISFIKEDLINSPDAFNVGNCLYNLISSIINNWNLGGENTATFKKWSNTYRMLNDICELANWYDTPEYRMEFVKVVKNITLDDREEDVFNPDAPILTKLIGLKGKLLKTTNDAVVLKSDMSKSDNEFTHANRIIHGPQFNGFTKVPYIILYNDEDMKNIENITRDLVKEYAREEFFNPNESYPVQILYNGKYFDERIKWETI